VAADPIADAPVTLTPDPAVGKAADLKAIGLVLVEAVDELRALQADPSAASHAAIALSHCEEALRQFRKLAV
jgi:hypothetical protein